MPRSKDDDTVKAASDAPKDPAAIESLVESEKAVAPLSAAELNALVIECCDLIACVDARYVASVDRMTRIPEVYARIAEIRLLVENHLTPTGR